MTTSMPRRARYRPWLVAAVASSAVLVPAMTAAATWQNSSSTLIEFRDVCRDGVALGVVGVQQVRGGVTALACRKPYPVFVDENALLFDEISVSAGQRGLQIVMAPGDYVRATQAHVADLTRLKD